MRVSYQNAHTQATSVFHYTMIFTTAVPGAVIWVLGLPVLMVYITRSKKDDCESNGEDSLRLSRTHAEEGAFDGAHSLLSAGYRSSSATYREAPWCVRLALLSIFTSELLPSYFSLLILAGAAFDQAYSKPFSDDFEVLGQAEVLGLATMFGYAFAVNISYFGPTIPPWLSSGAVILSLSAVAVYLIWVFAELWYSYREDKSTSLIRQMIASSAEGERLSISLTASV